MRHSKGDELLAGQNLVIDSVPVRLISLLGHANGDYYWWAAPTFVDNPQNRVVTTHAHSFYKGLHG